MARVRQNRDAGASTVGRLSWWKRFRERFSLPQIEAWSTTFRTVFLNALFLIAIVILLPVLISQFQRDQVVIESIGVPDTLSEQGLTGAVVASRVWDGLQDVVTQSNTAKDSIVAIPDARRVEFSFPDSGFSIESLVFHLRRLFNAYETRIAGEFVCADKDCARAGMRLRLRVIRQGVDLIDMPPIGDRSERDYFADAGGRVLALLDPFVALAALSETQPLKATTLARRLIRAHHKDAKWAHNLVGIIRQNQDDQTGAIEEFKAAITLDPGFLQARSNLGGALVRTGDLAGAKAEFDETLRRDPDNVWALEGNAELALANGDVDGAVKWLVTAADAAPVDPRYFAKAGKILSDQGRRDEAIAMLKRSLELDPGYPVAFAFLAAIHVGENDMVAAETVYRDAADYAPDDADAQASHARILAILQRWEDATTRYERATALEPRNESYWLEYGRCLQRLARLDDAAVALGKAAELAPKNADIQMSIADVHRDAGRKPEAIAAYKRYLELAKADAMMRPIAERFIELLSGES